MVFVGDLLAQRREYVERRLGELEACLGGAERIAGDKACVYLTGSFGRGEASEHSDLDVFIVGRGSDERPSLSRLDQICVKADLIHAARVVVSSRSRAMASTCSITPCAS